MQRELAWIWHDRVALFLVIGVPLLAFAVLSLTFSNAVIRDLRVDVVDQDQSRTSMTFVAGDECRARRQRGPPIGRPPRGDAGRPRRRRDCGGLHPARPRAGHGGGQAAADRHLLQQAVFHAGQHRVRRARRGGVGRHRRSAAGAGRFGRLHAGTAGRRAICADQSGAELRAVPAAGDPADRAARRGRRRRGLRRRIGVRRAQHGEWLAAAGGDPADRAGRQAGTLFRHLRADDGRWARSSSTASTRCRSAATRC